MDARTALKSNTTLGFNDGYEYTITNELARGGASIVYNAYYIDNLGERKTVRIKECYPFKCNLSRTPDGSLRIPEAERKLFADAKQKMQQAYQLGCEFFATDGLTNLTANTYNIFEANNTLYVVSAYAQGQELSYRRYSTVKDSVASVKGAAKAICRIHDKGFLYLDIKPGNILTLEGTTELIQLFDFDTVVPISDFSELNDKISFTRGFAALELQMGDAKRIGIHTDVYGIGALLFYMLFDRVPDAFDCENGAQYDFSKSKLASGDYQDALAFRLTDFFHHTLADYYLDRFSNMETVVEKLSELQTLADLSAHYLISTKISTPGFLLGREMETAWITERLTEQTCRCSFVVGMGGIGKSVLVRHCLRQCGAEIDSVLYLDFLGTVEKTICDDYAVQIHGIQKDKTESETAYFDRKLSILRDLSRGKNCVLVIDNYTGDAGDAFPKLLQMGWRILLLTRNKALAQDCDTLEIGPLSEENALQLFPKYIGHELSEGERRSAAAIIRSVAGHTLVIELIARQIGNPVCTLSLTQAAEIVEKYGFSNLAPEKAGCRKDGILYEDSIRQIISGLLASEGLPELSCTLLKSLSLFGRTGVSLDRLCEMLALKNRDAISTLYQQGWIYVEDAVVTMHPVIEEIVSGWTLTEAMETAAIGVLRYLEIRLRAEAQWEECKSCPGGLVDRKIPKILARDSSARTGEACLHGIIGYTENAAAGRDEIREILRLAMAVLDRGKREPKLYSSDIYTKLLYCTLLNTPYENEEFLQEKCAELIALLPQGNEGKLLKAYSILLEILYDHGDFETAKQIIRQAQSAISGSRSPEISGRYHYLLTGFYDAVLNGAYDGESSEEKALVRRLLHAADRAIRWLTVSHAADSGILLGECYRLKALVLIRSGIGRKRQVLTLLEKVRKLIDKYAQPNSRLVRDYHMTMAWYYTYMDEDYPQTCAYLSKAYEITGIISTSDLAKIDDQLCPMANVMLEWQQYDKAEMYLLRSIWTCAGHPEIAAYARRQIELLGHLLEVYFLAGEYERCRRVIEKIDEKVGESGVLRIEDYVPEFILDAVADSSMPAARL